MTSRWTSGMWSGIWSTSTSRPASGWAVACRLLGMLVAFAGLMLALFLVWEGVRVELIQRPEGWSGYYASTIAEQTSLGWQTLPGKLVAVAFGLILLHLLANLHRLRWLAPTYAAFFVCGFATIALSVWSLARAPELSDGAISWQTSEWQRYVERADAPKPASPTPREHLESLAASETSQGRDADLESLSHAQLIKLLDERGKLALSSAYSVDGPYAGIGLGIALAFVGLLEFIFIYAAEPTRRLLGGVRSSVSSRFSGRYADQAEPRISKMAVMAALLGVLPLMPLGFLLFSLFNPHPRRGEDFAIAIGFLVGLSVFPVTVGLFALYRIRRFRGLLHGLPLAFSASITWPLIVLDVIAISIAHTIERDSWFFVLMAAIVGNVCAFVYGWKAARQPLELPSGRSISP